MVVYIIATDPKPRMFIPAIACACLIVGLVATALWPKVRLVRPVLVVVALYRVVTMLFANDILAVAHNGYPAVGARAVATVPGMLYVDRWTRSRLDLAGRAVRDRLSLGAVPVGGLWMTSGNYVDDARGDTRPPGGGRWLRVARIVGTRLPWTFALVQRAMGLPAIAAPGPDYHPALTIYRRVG